MALGNFDGSFIYNYPQAIDYHIPVSLSRIICGFFSSDGNVLAIRKAKKYYLFACFE